MRLPPAVTNALYLPPAGLASVWWRVERQTASTSSFQIAAAWVAGRRSCRTRWSSQTVRLRTRDCRTCKFRLGQTFPSPRRFGSETDYTRSSAAAHPW
ncbi:hypothetical protein BDV29DRAFT_95600 [Aspergillus leporis]|uniref:Uncharacterized protein n=1 Tax=Aspergillus leporis TaxID=41062 RepID=A0A5N5X632_9EURO|nr:hypothetical protein BDV29DRAFT_95600 [Aspergillus leporis]